MALRQLTVVCCFALTTCFALALSVPFVGAQQSASAPKERKDYLLEALESQRNDGLAKLAICYADANDQIARLNEQLRKAQAELAAAKAPAAQP